MGVQRTISHQTHISSPRGAAYIPPFRARTSCYPHFPLTFLWFISPVYPSLFTVAKVEEREAEAEAARAAGAELQGEQFRKILEVYHKERPRLPCMAMAEAQSQPSSPALSWGGLLVAELETVSLETGLSQFSLIARWVFMRAYFFRFGIGNMEADILDTLSARPDTDFRSSSGLWLLALSMVRTTSITTR